MNFAFHISHANLKRAAIHAGCTAAIAGVTALASFMVAHASPETAEKAVLVAGLLTNVVVPFLRSEADATA